MIYNGFVLICMGHNLSFHILDEHPPAFTTGTKDHYQKMFKEQGCDRE
jgi:hypothetical protein